MSKAPVNLTGIPETMLWTLHNRANDAARLDGFLRDPLCVSIYRSIDYDYARSFGPPDASHPMRSRLVDDVVRPWLAAHPGGTVVELGAGLETQFDRCDDGRVRWLCVDVPEALAIRERFLPPSERCRHVPRSALDLAWLDEVDPARGVFVTAQGLLMYFKERDVQRLFTAIADRFPGVELMFDTIPPWFARKTVKGFYKTRHYRAPVMPWGVRFAEIEPLLRRWSPRVATVSVAPYGMYPRGLGGLLLRIAPHVPGLRRMPPTLVHVTTTGAAA